MIIAIIAIVIILVGSIILLTTNQNPGYDSPCSANKTWHDVTSFNGVNTTTTDFFSIKGNQSTITYTLVPNSQPAYSFFNLFIYPQGETALYTILLLRQKGVLWNKQFNFFFAF